MGGLLSCRWGHSWPGGFQGCELLRTTSVLAAIGDMTTSFLTRWEWSFQDLSQGVDLTWKS